MRAMGASAARSGSRLPARSSVARPRLNAISMKSFHAELIHSSCRRPTVRGQGEPQRRHPAAMVTGVESGAWEGRRSHEDVTTLHRWLHAVSSRIGRSRCRGALGPGRLVIYRQCRSLAAEGTVLRTPSRLFSARGRESRSWIVAGLEAASRIRRGVVRDAATGRLGADPGDGLPDQAMTGIRTTSLLSWDSSIDLCGLTAYAKPLAVSLSCAGAMLVSRILRYWPWLGLSAAPARPPVRTNSGAHPPQPAT